MTLKQYARTFAFTGVAVLVMAANSNAASITYNTTATTGFGGTSLTLNSVSGSEATLTFTPLASTQITAPSNINYGIFNLSCAGCTDVSGSEFAAFSFDMVVTDVGSGATGTFVGTSGGGQIFSNSSNLSIEWDPTQIGPGGLNATLGNFGYTWYTNEAVTNIVAPNSGLPVSGVTTVQGFVGSEVPEPATMGLIGFGLLGLAFIHRRRNAQR